MGSKKSSEQTVDAEVLGKDNVVVLNGATGIPREVAEDPELIRGRIVTLKNTIDNAYFELAQLLYKVWNGGQDGKPLYLQWGYASWNEYVEKELDFAIRKAQYLISIWSWFGVELGDETVIEKIRPLGWTKVKELVGVVSAANADEWIEKARDMSSTMLADEARAVLKAKKEKEAADKAGAGSSDSDGDKDKIEKLSHISFGLYEGQLQTVTAAMERAKELAGSDKKGYLLELICQDWLATNDAMRGTKKANVSKFMRKFEKLLGIRIVAIDPEAKEILCGADVAGSLGALDEGEEEAAG